MKRKATKKDKYTTDLNILLLDFINWIFKDIKYIKLPI